MLPSTSPRVGHVLRLVSLGLLVLAGAAIALIAGGAFDQQPCGLLTRHDTLSSLALIGSDEMLQRQTAPFTGGPRCYAVRLTAALAAGEMDSGYGLALGDERGRLVVAVSPLGHAAVWQTTAGDGERRYLLPWQPWPHVNTGTAPNEIWLEVANNAGPHQVTARVNRELLWQGNVTVTDTAAAPWLGSFGGPVTVDFRTLDWYVLTEGQ